MGPGDSAGTRGEPEGGPRFFDPLGEFAVAARVRYASYRRKPRRRRLHECLWCGRWFRPRERSSRLCSLACRHACHDAAIPAGVAAGQSDREIAGRLDISLLTVRRKRLVLRVLRSPEPPHLRRYRLGKDA